MDYEKNKEALAIVRQMISDGQVSQEVEEKYFPELAESEDEKIRKEIIRFVTKSKLFESDRKKYIDWLEKQGEQKQVEYANGDDYGIDGLWHAINILEKTLGKVEGYQTDDGILEHECAITAVAAAKADQKPVEWSKEEKKIISDVVGFINDGALPKEEKEYYVGKLLDLRPQKQWKVVGKEIYVKEPVLAQKKDKSDPFGGFVVCCDHTLTPNLYERFIKISDIYIQKQWKPTEEQIEALGKVVDRWFESSLSQKDDYNFYVLKKLKEQLKAL